MEPLRANLEEKQKLRNIKSLLQTESIPIPDIHVPLIEDVCDRIEKFLAVKEPEELQLDQYNGYVRKLLYQEVGKRFPHAYLETRTASDGNRTMFVMRSDGDENRKKLEEDKINKEINEVEEATGFCEVINLISLSGIKCDKEQQRGQMAFGRSRSATLLEHHLNAKVYYLHLKGDLVV
ncbi:unnamed protein product [Timema podura]|uniref:Uncharacterized protein n=1 Tax=Timema podura TaxID=61482 RepID=A0ABN7PGW5_TIMPD|nr:unnamed protein product [Timema podura]